MKTHVVAVSCCTCDTLMVINNRNDIHLINMSTTPRTPHTCKRGGVSEKMHSGDVEEIYDDMWNAQRDGN